MYPSDLSGSTTFDWRSSHRLRQARTRSFVRFVLARFRYPDKCDWLKLARRATTRTLTPQNRPIPNLLTHQKFFMTNFRFIPLAVALTAASTLVACNTAPSMPIPNAAAPSVAAPDHLAHMNMQTKTMQAMHEKMVSAKTPEERSKLMAEHMKSMQDGMKMMEGMASPGMIGMAGMKGMSDGMGAHHAMMEKRMAMMQTIMKMMMDRLPDASRKQ